MITWEHVRFLALLIPTWLLLVAVAVTLAVHSRSAAGPSEASAAQASVVACTDSGDIAVQQRKGELVVAVER